MQIRSSAIHTLIFANAMGYLMEVTGSDAFLNQLALWPLNAGFMPWQLVTYAFLHANMLHLMLNMFGLWMFGRELEQLLGRRAIFTLYFCSVLSAGGMQLLVTMLSGNINPTVGASGGVFGILLAFGMYFPNRIIILLIPPIPLPAWLFVTLYAGAELLFGVTGTAAGVAHFAHLGGMIGAYLLVRRWRHNSRYCE